MWNDPWSHALQKQDQTSDRWDLWPRIKMALCRKVNQLVINPTRDGGGGAHRSRGGTNCWLFNHAKEEACKKESAWHNVHSSPNFWCFLTVATWKYILSKWPNSYCLFHVLFKRCVTSVFISYHLKFNYSQYTMYKRLKNWMIGCNTHLLKHMKQAILVWSFRQNIFPGCYREKTSKYGRAVDIVDGVNIKISVLIHCTILKL